MQTPQCWGKGSKPQGSRSRQAGSHIWPLGFRFPTPGVGQGECMCELAGGRSDSKCDKSGHFGGLKGGKAGLSDIEDKANIGTAGHPGLQDQGP